MTSEPVCARLALFHLSYLPTPNSPALIANVLHFISDLFTFLMVSFKTQKFFILMMSGLSIFTFAVFVLSVLAKKALLSPTQCHKDFFFLCVVLRLKSRSLCTQGKCSTTDPHH